MKKWHFEVAIIGGGLGGLLAAHRLAQANIDFVLIDDSLPASEGKLGGFAAFSGAKFSLPPAGLGLVSTVGDIETLNSKINEVLKKLGLYEKHAVASRDNTPPDFKTNDYCRQYESIVLTPAEIQELISRLSTNLVLEGNTISGRCLTLRNEADCWALNIFEHSSSTDFWIQAKTVFYAGGRLGNNLLEDAGAAVTEGKGVDIGIRIETLESDALSNLRKLGPDAKIIHDNVRTFCLNVPGLIHYYKSNGINIPGGIVADQTVKTANVGVLVRVNKKAETLKRITEVATNRDFIGLNQSIYTGPPRKHLERATTTIFGDAITQKLSEFCEMLGHEQLIDWRKPYKLHVPLIDWHWSTFGKPGSHKTTLKDLYVVGDSSGHARGLLQAAVSGWIAAEEFLND